jgi:hypothetical protein
MLNYRGFLVRNAYAGEQRIVHADLFAGDTRDLDIAVEDVTDFAAVREAADDFAFDAET